MSGAERRDGQPALVTLVVDMANVVGARPDGWWRDRAAATTRLLNLLAPLVDRKVDGPDGPVVVGRVVAVTEGAGRQAADVAGVQVVRASDSGDDTVVSVASRVDRPLVVTSDRGLRARLPAGVVVAGPSWLLGCLE